MPSSGLPLKPVMQPSARVLQEYSFWNTYGLPRHILLYIKIKPCPTSKHATTGFGCGRHMCSKRAGLLIPKKDLVESGCKRVKDIVLYGAGGMALEVVQLIEDINELEPTWNILGYIDDYRGGRGSDNPVVNGYRILGTHKTIGDFDKSVRWVIAGSDPKAKRTIHDSLRIYDLKYATLIHPTAKISKNVSIGEGTIVSYGCIVSVNAVLESHIYLNMRTVIGHDTVVKSFSTCLIDCIVAGNVLINEGVLLGSNCVIKEKKTIGKNAKISMGSAVFFDVEDNVAVMNRPPKSMRF